MSSDWGGAWGGGQGGREFSPTASLAKLPGVTRRDRGQGGGSQDRLNPPEPPKPGFGEELVGLPPHPLGIEAQSHQVVSKANR